jgi:hypothetical protein
MMTHRLLPRLLLGLLVVSVVALPAARAGAQPTPAAVVETSAFEFEPVVDGEAVRHAFTIANRGEVPLRLLKVRTG